MRFDPSALPTVTFIFWLASSVARTRRPVFNEMYVMIRLAPRAVPAVRNSWTLKSSGVAFFSLESWLREALVRITAHVSGSASAGETLPCTVSCTARQGSSRTYVDSRIQRRPAIGEGDLSFSTEFHLSAMRTLGL